MGQNRTILRVKRRSRCLLGCFFLLCNVSTYGLVVIRPSFKSIFCKGTNEPGTLRSYSSGLTRQIPTLYLSKTQLVTKSNKDLQDLMEDKSREPVKTDQVNSGRNANTSVPAPNPPKKISWIERVEQLKQYQRVHGDMLVPRRYKSNPSLGNWVNKQRQQYRIYNINSSLRHEYTSSVESNRSNSPMSSLKLPKLKPCALNAERIELLTNIGFCWDATNITAITNALAISSSWLSQENVASDQTGILRQDATSATDVHSCADDDFIRENNDSQQPILLRQQQQKEDNWWRRLDEIRALQADSTPAASETVSNAAEGPKLSESSSIFLQIPARSSLGSWVLRQRQEYSKYITLSDEQRNSSQRNASSRSGEVSSMLDQRKINALNEIDPEWWKSHNQRIWECRYQELKEYQQVHGDCCVPISYQNRKLANWVSNQRKKYNQKMGTSSSVGKMVSAPSSRLASPSTSTISDEQIDKLNDIGFVWNRWEHEFMKKDVKLGWSNE